MQDGFGARSARKTRKAGNSKATQPVAAPVKRPAEASAEVEPTKLAARLPVALPLLPAAAAKGGSARRRALGWTAWEWALAAAFLLIVWVCR